ncbi:MAG: carboxypeptidase regulatory-like domain-containing protein [Candidatus Woesearchaeota archaeon]
MIKKFVILIGILFLILILSGCVEDIMSGKITGSRNGSITGQVVNESKEGISEVEVKIDDKTRFTGPEGFFTVKELEVGNHILRLSHPEYKSINEEINIEDGSNSLGEISLKKEDTEINLNPHLGVVSRKNNDDYHYSFRLLPNVEDISIDGKVEEPGGNTWNLKEYEEDESFGALFTIDELITGEFELSGDVEDNKFSYTFYVDKDGFDEAPIIISPNNGLVINEDTEFNFELTTKPDRVHMVIKEDGGRGWTWIYNVISGSEIEIGEKTIEISDIEDEIELISGKEYEWAIHLSSTCKDNQNSLTYEIRSEIKSFKYE